MRRQTSPTPNQPRAPSAFAVPNVRLYLSGQALSNIGTFFQIVGLTLLVLKLTGSGLPSAVALASSAQSVGRLGGPPIAAVVYASFRPAWCFAINAASYLAVVVMLLQLRRAADEPLLARSV